MTRTRTLLLSGLLACCLAAPALAQDDPVGPPPTPQPKPDPAPQTEPAPSTEPAPAGTEAAPPPAPDRAGRKKFERDQGQADALKGQLERLLAVVKGADVDAKATGEALRSLAPDEKALKDAFTEAGFKELGAELLEGAQKLFAGETPLVLERLGLRADLETVEIFRSSTEDLLTMESGTDAAREFASGLRRAARHLKPRYHWYCAVLRSKVEGSQECRLQLFFHTDGRWVLLGRIWRLDE